MLYDNESMKTLKTIAGNNYVVYSKNGGTVTDASGTLNKAVEAGDFLFIPAAPSDMLMCDDDESVIKQVNFKSAALALRLLGGGNKNALPAGYLQAYFLESTGTQIVRVGKVSTRTVVKLRAAVKNKNSIQSAYGGTLNSLPINGFGFVFSGGWQYPNQFSFNSGRQIYVDMGIRLGQAYSILQDSKKIVVDAQEYIYTSQPNDMACEVALYARLEGNGAAEVAFSNELRLYYFLEDGDKRMSLSPVISPTGEPCMFDTVTREPFFNSGTGSFIVGFTRSQARKLGKLPSGTTLTVSLPVGYDGDDGVVSALAQAADNGCVLTVQTYEESEAAAASTYALHRVWVRRWQEEAGAYVDADGVRWQVEWCVDVVGADPVELGFERFRSVDAARDYWGLVDYVDPESEPETELITEPELLTVT